MLDENVKRLEVRLREFIGEYNDKQGRESAASKNEEKTLDKLIDLQ